MKIYLLKLLIGASCLVLSAFGLVPSPTSRLKEKRILLRSTTATASIETPTVEHVHEKNEKTEDPIKMDNPALVTTMMSEPKEEPATFPVVDWLEESGILSVFKEGINELWVLLATVVIAAFTPTLVAGNENQETLEDLIVPTMTLIAAVIGLLAEYVGKTAVCDSKEIAMLSVQAAAESEILFAKAEKSKAALPVCLGLTTTTTVFSVIAPYALQGLATLTNTAVNVNLYIVLPMISIVGAMTAFLANDQTVELCNSAIGVGERRFSSSKDVGKTWLSLAQQVKRTSLSTTKKWFRLAAAGAMGPLLGALCPGPTSFKCFIVSAITAAQSAFYLANSEFSIARCTDALALKVRSAATSDKYANEGQGKGAILPFTSALGGLCTAGSTAIGIFISTDESLLLKTGYCAVFPLLASLLAAAATVSKERCLATLDQARVAADTIRVGVAQPVTVERVLKTSMKKIGQVFKLSVGGVERFWRLKKHQRSRRRKLKARLAH